MFLKQSRAALFAAGLLLPAVAAAETSIRFGTHITPVAVEMADGVIPYLEAVEAETAGEVTFQQFPGGALGRNPAQQYDLLRTGVQDMTVILPSYSAAQFPDFGIFALPYLFDTAEEGSVAAWRMYEAGLMDTPDDIHVITTFINGNSAIHTKDPIASPDDLKGMRIRAAGPDESAIVESLGAVPVGMGIGQIAESMDRGVVDGALSGWAAMRAFRFDELSHGHLQEPLGSRAFVLAMRKNVYDALSDKAKAVIDARGGEELARAIGKANDEAEARIIADATAREGVSVVTIPGDQAEARAALFAPVAEGWVKESGKNASNMKALREILAAIAAE